MSEVRIVFRKDKFLILLGPSDDAELHQTATIEGAIVHAQRECVVIGERLGKNKALPLVIDPSVADHFANQGFDGDPMMKDN